MNKLIEEFQNRINANSLLYPLDVLIVGATGVGKSTTINAIMQNEVAKVGHTSEPETKDINAFSVHKYLRIHDSAGCGDSTIIDLVHKKNIINELTRTVNVDNNTYGFIDLVLVILDGSSRDLGTTFDLLESTILNFIDQDRVIVAINQADMAMKGRNWDSSINKPNQVLIDFLKEKSDSIKNRIFESTKLKINAPIYYSSRYGYNTDSLIKEFIKKIPTKRRVIN